MAAFSGPILAIAVGLFLAGVISEVVSFVYAITFTVNGGTVYYCPMDRSLSYYYPSGSRSDSSPSSS